MSEIDQRTSNAIAQLRDAWSPPNGSEDRMLADFHARLGPSGDGGDGGDGGELPGGGAGGQWIYVAKIVGAVVGLTAAGLGGLAVAAKLVRTLDRPEPPRERAAVIATNEIDRELERGLEPSVEPSSDLDAAAPTSVEQSPSEPELEAATASAPPKPKVARESQQVDLAAELALIQAARAAESEQALVLLERHAREFPNGALSSEREALRAVASCTLDRLDDARVAVERLSALEPGPLLRKRVQAACGKKLELPTTDSARGGDGSR